jgi:thiol-disulfide isomerase/thioredoxin
MLLATHRLEAQASGIAVGAKAPAATVMTLDGKPVELGSMLGGTPVMIEFFATWCPLCRQLEPQMKALQARHGTAVKFITITVPDNQSPERVRQYVEKNQLGGTFLFDRDGAAVKAFQVPHTSYVVVVDRNGTVVYTGVGGEQDLAAALGMVIRP